MPSGRLLATLFFVLAIGDKLLLDILTFLEFANVCQYQQW